jgi:PhzF family phenazine biosynthesis protein
MRAYKVVDVFTSKPLLGNPVAVVLDGDGLDSAQMQAIARWTNLSETTFLLPPTVTQADYRLRIFTPLNELAFAGHPTLGSAHAALEAGRIELRSGTLIQECGVGMVKLSAEGVGEERQLILDMPTPRVTELTPEDVIELEAVLGQPILRTTPPAIIDVGAVWVVAQLSTAEQVLELKPDLARSAQFERRLGLTGITVFGKHRSAHAAIEVRTFAPSCGVNEDPVCGSGNGSVAVFQQLHGMLPVEGLSYVAAQGQCVGRDGRIAVTVDKGGKINVGGRCVTVVDGSLRI